MPPSITQAVTFLYTRDLARTDRFYQEILALPLVLDQGGCRVYAAAPNAFLGFCQRENAAQSPQGIIFTFVTDDVDGWHAHLQAQAVEITKPPTFYPEYNIYHLFALDPNGYQLEFQRFLDPSWPAPLPG